MSAALSVCLLTLAAATRAAAASELLPISVYATAGDVQRYLGTQADRERAAAVLQSVRVRHLFLEGRRGDEHVPATQLREVRDFFVGRGFRCSGGIATVPGSAFGTRQNAGLDWLNWENARTRHDVAGFFAESAPLFDELIVDDFYCTADTSPESQQARGHRSWGTYRRDLLVSLIDPLFRRPALAVHPKLRLIVKYPQWYDRFHLFGYDPARMSPRFDQVWVGTEVRNPKTRRMGFVQPTEGYINFRWLSSVAGKKVRGAWFDHIECSAQQFVDQACQSVLAGAQELTLFHLGDLMADHPGDALLAARLPELSDIAARISGQRRDGVAFYKPSSSASDENIYLMDYLAMIGLPMVPESRYPRAARVAFLAVQAAADPQVLRHAREHLDRGATLVLTPAFVRAVGPAAARLAGVQTEPVSHPVMATCVQVGTRKLRLAPPLEINAGFKAVDSVVRASAEVDGRTVPWLTFRSTGRGQVFVLNVRTFSEEDFLGTGEWLLAPKALGLLNIPESLANELRAACLSRLGVKFDAPACVALYLFEHTRCVCNFRDEPAHVSLDGHSFDVPPNQWLWVSTRKQ